MQLAALGVTATAPEYPWGQWLSDPDFRLIHGTRMIVLLEDLGFRDRRGREHWAPAGFASDANSAPAWSYSFTGDKLTPRYRRSSVLHDLRCLTHALPALETHRLYYEGLRADGTHPFAATIFHAMTVAKNPRW